MRNIWGKWWETDGFYHVSSMKKHGGSSQIFRHAQMSWKLGCFFSRDSMLEVSSTTYWDVMHTVHGFNPTNNVINGPKTISQKVQGMICDDLPSGYVKIAIENGHWNSWFSRDKLWFSSSLCGSLPEGTGNVQCSLSVDGQCSFSRPRR